jgi:hypothetical protein
VDSRPIQSHSDPREEHENDESGSSFEW